MGTDLNALAEFTAIPLDALKDQEDEPRPIHHLANGFDQANRNKVLRAT